MPMVVNNSPRMTSLTEEQQEEVGQRAWQVLGRSQREVTMGALHGLMAGAVR